MVDVAAAPLTGIDERARVGCHVTSNLCLQGRGEWWGVATSPLTLVCERGGGCADWCWRAKVVECYFTSDSWVLVVSHCK